MIAAVALHYATHQRFSYFWSLMAAAISRESPGTCFSSASLRRGNIVKNSDPLGRVILVIEDEPLIALDLNTTLEADA
jgi:hypothetical protein